MPPCREWTPSPVSAPKKRGERRRNRLVRCIFSPSQNWASGYPKRPSLIPKGETDCRCKSFSDQRLSKASSSTLFLAFPFVVPYHGPTSWLTSQSFTVLSVLPE